MTPELAKRLVQDAPEVQAARLMDHLLTVTGASGGAALSIEGPDLRAVVDRTTVDRLGIVHRMFWDYHDDLSRGVGVNARDLCLMPLSIAGRLVGLLMLVGVTVESADVSADVSLTLAAAVDTPAPVPAVRPSTFDDLKREHILKRLEVHRWNITAVASEQGCTRRTIYAWLEGWGVPRRKVQKSRRKTLIPAEGL